MNAPGGVGGSSAAAVVLVMTAVLASGGCETTEEGAEAESLSLYNAGQYQQARNAAEREVRRSRGVQRDQARFVLGMSAYRLGRGSEAIEHLRQAAESGDRTISGRAHATLGLIYAGRSEHHRAIRHLEQATRKLDGDDEARAYYHLALSEQKLGRWASARTHLSLAVSSTSDPSLRRAARQQQDATGYTLQLGAFSEKSNADEHALQMRSRTSGIGSPRVIPSTTSSGDRLYLVQVGRFSTFASAAQARRRLGRTDVMITPLSE